MSKNIEIWKLSDNGHSLGTITFEVDRDVLTPELAKEALAYWEGGDNALREAGGDAVKALVMFAGFCLFEAVANECDGCLANNAESIEVWNRIFQNDLEGWSSDYGIELVGGSVHLEIEPQVESITKKETSDV